jgi:hypothetical protein
MHSGNPNIRTLPVSATWAHHREPRPAAATRPVNRRPLPTVGRRTELARYTVAGAEWILYGQRVAGVVRVTDRPARPGGRSYLVERKLERDGNGALDALVVDYLAQAQKLAAVPMSVAPLESWLEAIA